MNIIIAPPLADCLDPPHDVAFDRMSECPPVGLVVFDLSHLFILRCTHHQPSLHVRSWDPGTGTIFWFLWQGFWSAYETEISFKMSALDGV